MRRNHRIKLATASVSIAAALASPTFGVVNLVLQAGATQNVPDSQPINLETRIILNHTAESTDPLSATRTVTKLASDILKSSAPGYQLPSATLLQNGAPGTGSSTGRIGIGYITDSRSASLSVQSLTFVNQNEVNNPQAPGTLMDGKSTISADFRLVFKVVGDTNFGSPMVGRIGVPLKVDIQTGSTGTAEVRFDNVKWEVDQAADGVVGNFFRARDTGPGFENGLSLTTGVLGVTTSTTLSSDSQILKNSTGGTLILAPGDIFVLSGKLSFIADGNSPAGTTFNFAPGTSYSQAVLDSSPVRYYKLNEDSFHTPPPPADATFIPVVPVPPAARFAYDSSAFSEEGIYVGDVTPEAEAAQFSLGTAAQFPVLPPVSTFSDSDPVVSVITAPHSAELNFTDASDGGDGNAFTVEAWIKQQNPFVDLGADPALDYFAALVEKRADGAGPSDPDLGWRFGINNDSLFLGDGAGGGIDAAMSLPSEEIFDMDVFHYVVAVYDGAGFVRFYVNGVQIGAPQPYSLLEDSPGLLRIGNSYTGLDPFGGIIDEVAIYRTALSGETIASRYNRGQENSSLIPLIGFEIDETFAEGIIPEPATAMLGILGLAGLAATRRRAERV